MEWPRRHYFSNALLIAFASIVACTSNDERATPFATTESALTAEAAPAPRLGCANPFTKPGPPARTESPKMLRGGKRLPPSEKAAGKKAVGEGPRAIAALAPTLDAADRNNEYLARAAELKSRISDPDKLRAELEKTKPAILYGSR